MNNISAQEALNLLDWASDKNPGAWKQHSLNVARAAQTIAKHCNLDCDLAYNMGLLHDIGRHEGIRHMHHIISGYQFMIDKKVDSIARICLTHSFPIQDIRLFSGQRDCTNKEIDFLELYLKSIEYNDYDKLIQLCDALGDARGISIIDLRLMDVAKRSGINELTIKKWNAFDELKNYFSKLCGKSIYSYFYDEICKNILNYLE